MVTCTAGIEVAEQDQDGLGLLDRDSGLHRRGAGVFLEQTEVRARVVEMIEESSLQQHPR